MTFYNLKMIIFHIYLLDTRSIDFLLVRFVRLPPLMLCVNICEETFSNNFTFLFLLHLRFRFLLRFLYVHWVLFFLVTVIMFL